MLIRFIGDCHGRFPQYKRLIKDVEHSIQVGDMGVGFRRWPHGEASQNPPYDAMTAGDHRFIRGNHDNPGVCARHSQWIPDGNIECGVMFIGGGFSIDYAYRYPDYDWWEDEELSTAQLNELVDVYIKAKPRVMVTHDCPEEVAAELARSTGIATKLDPRLASRTRQAFQSMFSAHSPDTWIFGHWHHSFDHVINGTQFICLAELEHRDIDLPFYSVLENAT